MLMKYIGLSVVIVSVISALFGGSQAFALGTIYGVACQWFGQKWSDE
jgi:hypothetical protein